MPRVNRTAEVVWTGDSRHGQGHISTESGALKDAPYSWPARFQDAAGTNPEELVAAAHAACYSMALASALTRKGHPPERIETRAICSMTREEGSGVNITTVRLETRALVPGIEPALFVQTAQEAERDCPVSKALRGGIAIELDAALT